MIKSAMILTRYEPNAKTNPLAVRVIPFIPRHSMTITTERKHGINDFKLVEYTLKSFS